jgi:hypothetical protein
MTAKPTMACASRKCTSVRELRQIASSTACRPRSSDNPCIVQLIPETPDRSESSNNNTRTLDVELWGEALADAVGPHDAPAPSTLREWVWSFALSAEWLLSWLQHTLALPGMASGGRIQATGGLP